MTIKTAAEYFANGKTPEVLFWVGCAGSFDQRAQKITGTHFFFSQYGIGNAYFI